LFTGLRRTEAATLKWEDVDLEGKVLTIRSEVTKNHHEHRLPLSEFLCALLKQRKSKTQGSEYVFPGRDNKHHMVDSDHVYHGMVQRS
jgi:integrase